MPRATSSFARSAIHHFVRRDLHAPAYLRLVDDMVIFGRGRAGVAEWRTAAESWLDQRRDLCLKDPNAPVRSCRGTLHALGFRISRTRIVPAKRAYRGLARLAEATAQGDSLAFARRSVASRVGHVMFA